MQRIKQFHRYAGRLLLAGIPFSILSNSIARAAVSPESGLDSEFGQLIVMPSLVLFAFLLGIVSVGCYALGIIGYVIRASRKKKAKEEELPDQLED